MYAFYFRRHFVPVSVNEVLSAGTKLCVPSILAGTFRLSVVLKSLTQSSMRHYIFVSINKVPSAPAEILRYLSKMCLDSECWDIARIEQNIQFEMCLLKKC